MLTVLHLNFWTKGNCRKHNTKEKAKSWVIFHLKNRFMYLHVLNQHWVSFWAHFNRHHVLNVPEKAVGRRGQVAGRQDDSWRHKFFWKHMKLLEPIHKHHTLRRAPHVPAGQWISPPVFFSSPLPPSFLVSSALSSTTTRSSLESAFYLRCQKETRKGAHTSLHALSISLAKLGRRTFCLKRNRWIEPSDWVRPKVHRVQYPARQWPAANTWMVQAYHKASPLPTSSKLWLKISCARDCIFALNCPRCTSLPWICLIAFWTYLDFWYPQHPVAMNSSLIVSCMKKYFPFV